MKRFFTLILIACSLAATAVSAAPKYAKESKTPQLLRDAQTAVNQKNIEKTIAAYKLVFAQPDLLPADKVEAQFKLAQVYMSQKTPMRSEAFAEIDKVLKMPEATPEQKMRVYTFKANLRFRDNFPHGGYVNDDDGILDALALYREAQKIPDLNNASKIELAKQVANCHLELMQVDSANAELAKAAVLPGLTEAERNTALLNQAAVFKRQLRPDLALPIYKKVLQSKDLHINTRTDILVTVATSIESKEGRAKAEAYLKSQPDSERAQEKFADNHSEAGRISGSLKKLADKKNKLDARKREFRYCLDMAVIHIRSWKLMDELLDKYYPELMAENSDDAADVLRLFTKPSGHQMKIWLSNPEQHAKGLAAAAKYQPDDPDLLQMQYANAKALKDYRRMMDLYGKLMKIEKLPQDKRDEYTAVNAVLTGSNPAAVAKQVRAAAMSKSAEGKAREPKAIVDFLQGVARFALSVDKTDIARAIWAERNSFIVPESQRSVTVSFVKNAPRDITQFLASPYVKDQANTAVLDRKFGDNLQLILETDVATGNRQITADTGKAAQPSKFVALCDAAGVKIFFMMPCDRERTTKIRNGFPCYGGHEMYLATGFDQPYHCFLVDMPPNETPGDGFVTMYDNRTFRRYIAANKNFKFTFRVDDEMIYMLCEFDWSAVMNGIPRDGDFWEFDSIHWERGGYTWGGCKSVHERSSFGRLVFANMTPENRTAIKRRLLTFAKNAYNAQVNQNDGFLGGWQDRELGDRKFYKDVIVPFCEKYGAYAKAISPEMTDAEVNRIFDEAYPTLINTKFVVEAMRSDYIKRQLNSED